MNEMNVKMSLLEQTEWDYLTHHLRLTSTVSSDKERSISAADLLDEVKSGPYLDRLASVFESPNRMVTASLFAKRYAAMLVSSGLYAMTMYDKGLKLSIANCHLESTIIDERWMPNVRLSDVRVTEPTGSDREAWREQVTRSIFGDHLGVVWRSISKAAKIPRTILWENTAIYVYVLYESRMAEEADEGRRVRVQEDLAYLTAGAPAELFGENYNPLAKYYSPKCMVEGVAKPIRPRKTCCFFYQVDEDEDYCNSCPKRRA
ncbi:(2Fe-2S)-binding protein [Paenibacillus bouchesdurhonensis]|uniref:(2Fe-2S)-binding protein n=1 Tax=Paenibacillus bouchesdurhonensis TaxID=1870990 RepID=UPI001F1E8A2F|nr:(2Fe-2S)-binding protein [Paenibacillus bouchesdurhonensis]